MRARRALALAALVSCTRTRDPAPAPPDPLAPLRTFEEERRHATSFVDQPVQDRAFGADPYALVALPDGRLAGILRGRDLLVVLDPDLREVMRVPTPRAPSAIALYEGGVLVASEVEPVLARYSSAFQRLPDLPIGTRDVRAVLASRGTIHLVEERGDRLIELVPKSRRNDKRAEYKVPRGPLRLAQTKNALLVVSVIDHALTAFPLDTRGRIAGAPVTTTIDGPFWSVAAEDDLVLAGGVEDHPLDRRGGFFGYVDSFVYGYRLNAGKLEKLFAVNVSEHGLIVPKAIAFSQGEAFVTSYGGDRALRMNRETGAVIEAVPFPPGASAIVATGRGFVAANPLLDAWVTSDRIVRVEDNDARTDRERLGEALFFTGLMAPAGSSEGEKSRFSCETCHFEGYVDGRAHHTGRGDVHATTKPLVGLFNNRPHFSRALDPDLSAVAENEFRVAGAPSPEDPHWTLDTARVPWLGLKEHEADAPELRRSLMAFLMSFTHRTNPAAHAFTSEERAGAVIFRDRCEGCHSARTASDDAASHVPFEKWESLIEHGGAIVWGSDAYEKTGVTPYVHDRGARVPSLRRLYKKRPYFTNGSAPDIETALRAVRFAPFSHAGGDGIRLDDASVSALHAFLELL